MFRIYFSLNFIVNLISVIVLPR